jgi:hypothetical protein
MDKITKKFTESFITETKYNNMLARRYPDLTREEAEKKIDETIKNQIIPEVYNMDLSDPNPMNLAETPIDNFQTIGNWDKGSSFTSPVDRKLLTNPNAVQKIKDKFANTKFHFDMYFVNTKEARHYTEEGEVSEQFIRDNLKLDTPINHDNITVFYTNNKGDQKVMATAWIIAHRFGHAIRRLDGYKTLNNEVNEIIQRVIEEAYGRRLQRSSAFATLGDGPTDAKILKNFAQLVGTFKSARDKNLRNFPEFYHELLAQYITTGKISFNPLPKYIPVKYAWGRPSEGLRSTVNEHDIEYYSGYMDSLANDVYPDYADECLRECQGRIFVM